MISLHTFYYPPEVGKGKYWGLGVFYTLYTIPDLQNGLRYLGCFVILMHIDLYESYVLIVFN